MAFRQTTRNANSLIHYVWLSWWETEIDETRERMWEMRPLSPQCLHFSASVPFRLKVKKSVVCFTSPCVDEMISHALNHREIIFGEITFNRRILLKIFFSLGIGDTKWKSFSDQLRLVPQVFGIQFHRKIRLGGKNKKSIRKSIKITPDDV